MSAEQLAVTPRPYVPEIPAGTTVRDAALLYAQAGWYVAPVDPETKNPGSRLGKGWQLQTSRDPSVITAWWQHWPEASLALHVGRSGAVCLDVDDPNQLPHSLFALLVPEGGGGPFQSTRATGIGAAGRGHYLFAAEPGAYGNSLAGFREAGLAGWGEVRGLNAVIVVEPSAHTKPGGRYRWVTVGQLPDVPPELAALLRPPGAASGPVAVHEVDDFLSSLPGPECCPVVRGALDQCAAELAAMDPGGRHDYMLSAVQRLVRLGEQGHHGAAGALEELYGAFVAAKPEAGETEYYDAVTGAVRNVLAAQTLPAEVGCCPSWLQERWMQANGFIPPPPVLPAAVTPASPDGVVVMGPWHTAGAEPMPQVRNGTGKFTDAALAETLAAETLVGRYRWAPGLKWLRWDGAKWTRVPDADVLEAARTWALGHIGAAAMAMTQAGPGEQVDDTEVKAWTAVAKSAGRIGSLVKLAQGIGGILTEAGAFDADPDVLNVRNGVVHLPTGELMPADPRRLVTKIADVEYHPGAKHPDWYAALEALPPDEREWLQLRLGQAVTGHMTPDDVMPICQGTGENGKGTLFDAVVAALGDYHVRLADRVLTASPDAHPTELMELRGARLATIDETPEGRQLNVVRLKKTVGSTYITARYIAQDSVTYTATHSLFVLTNYEPIVTETDHGTWRRLAMLRFPYTFRKPGEPLQGPMDRHGDPGLRQRLQHDPAARSAVLAWLVDGAWAWYAAGAAQMPPHTDRVKAATDKMRADSDAVYGYWSERLEPADGYAVLASDLLADFNQWLTTAKNMQPWGDRMLKSRFGDHQLTASHRVRHQRVKRYAGDPVLSRPSSGSGYGHPPVPGDPVLWIGMRFQDGLSTGQTPPVDNPKPAGQDPVGHVGHGTPDASREEIQAQNDRSSVPSVPTSSYPPVSPPGSGSQDSVTQSEPAADSQPVDDGGDKPETAVQRNKRLKLEAKAAALSEALGPDVQLPAVVDRRGSVISIGLADAETLLTGLPRLTVDVETSGVPIGHEAYELRLIQLGCADFGVVLDPYDRDQALLAKRMLAEAPRLGAHSAVADIVPLAVAGLLDFDAAWERMDDTVTPAKLFDPHSTGSDAGLKEIAAYMLGDESASTPADAARKAAFKAGGWLEQPKADTPLARNGWYQIPPRSATMVRYAGADVLDTGLIGDRFDTTPLPTHIADRERKVAHTVSRIALHGVPINGELVDNLMTEHTAARGELTERITSLWPITNVGSDKQVAQTLQDLGVQLPMTQPSKTYPQGQPSVAAGVLDTIRPQYHDSTAEAVLMDDILAWRKHDTVITSFLTPYSRLVHHGDGRARPTVYTLQADTGRMSCVRPNFQQLPREGGIRAIITADPGFSLISADFSSVEIRVAAALSQDQVLIRMLAEGLDPHGFAAEIVYGPGWTKAQRYAVKRGVFGRIYGGGVKTLARQMGTTTVIAQKLIDAIDTLWPTLSQWSKDMTRRVEAGFQTTFETYSGRVIHLPKDRAYAAPNYAIQGTARELEVDAVLAWRETHWGTAVMWPVHDENDAMVPTAEADDATAAMVSCMTSELYGVPITVEASEPSTYWRDSA